MYKQGREIFPVFLLKGGENMDDELYISKEIGDALYPILLILFLSMSNKRVPESEEESVCEDK